jgi:hypothetical protein
VFVQPGARPRGREGHPVAGLVHLGAKVGGHLQKVFGVRAV